MDAIFLIDLEVPVVLFTGQASSKTWCLALPEGSPLAPARYRAKIII